MKGHNFLASRECCKQQHLQSAFTVESSDCNEHSIAVTRTIVVDHHNLTSNGKRSESGGKIGIEVGGGHPIHTDGEFDAWSGVWRAPRNGGR
jgi:hypothetical protein